MKAGEKKVEPKEPGLQEQAAACIAAANHVRNLSNEIHSRMTSEFGLIPCGVVEFAEKAAALLDWSNYCGQRAKDGKPLLEGADSPMLKVALLKWRRKHATDLERPRSRTTDRGIIGQLNAELYCIHWLLKHPDLSVEPATVPRLTDYMSVQRAEIGSVGGALSDREYDQKFGVLLSAPLVDGDFEYYRAKCDLRGVPLSLAFMDIDDFKPYNTKFGHTAVDRELLPKLQQAVEAHTFQRGEAYRVGGDEFITILPNMSEAQA